jgi:hypothetical protein
MVKRILASGRRAIARKYGIPYVQLQRKCELANRDFRDLWHLLPKSRMKWQLHLSAKVA